jgi:hypothetical protein
MLLPPRVGGGADSDALVGKTVNVSVVLPVALVAKLTDDGLKPQEKYCAYAAGRLQLKVTVPVKLVAVQGMGYVLLPVAEMLMAGTVQLTAAGGAAKPESWTVWGFPLALSATLSTAVSEPTELLGVKITLMPQLPPAATLLPHVFV